MSKVITFSRHFPAYHPKAGQPTYFVEKFWASRHTDYGFKALLDSLDLTNSKMEVTPKHQTIRDGHRFKKGDYFSPRVWGNDINPSSGLSGPYQSKQIIIGPDTLITDVWDFEIKPAHKILPLDYDTDIVINHRFFHSDDEIIKTLATNDGLTISEFLQWFKYPKPFDGQIICWNDNIKY